MTLIASDTLAQTQARQNFQANLASLSLAQPDLQQWLTDQVLHLEWVFARDRSLTAIDEFGGWVAGCSLPGRAATAALAKLQIKGAVGCFLTPMHSAYLKEALTRLRPEQAIVAIVPDHRDLAMLLHCDDLSEAIGSHRLWFAAGPAWDVGLKDLFERQSGLATPSQFIRTPDADPEQAQLLIVTAQQIFAQVSAARTQEADDLAKTPIASRSQRTRVCVVAPSRFRLWNDLGGTLNALFDTSSPVTIHPFNTDDPLCSAPLALLKAVRQCDAILTTNTGRSDLPGLVPESTPWITWVTAARIPSTSLAGPWDHLLVSDDRLIEIARTAGWPATRVALARWPAQELSVPANAEKQLALIADINTLDTPADLAEYSSHSILWESIRHELLNDPFVLSDIKGYLQDRMHRARVGEQSFPAVRFIDRLIVPAYQQGLARTLIQAGLPLRVYGEGWETIPEFAPLAGGTIRSADQLRRAIESSTALIHAWPTNLAHPIDSIPLPSVTRGAGTKDAFLQAARAALIGRLAPSPRRQQPISAELIGGILRSTSTPDSDKMR